MKSIELLVAIGEVRNEYIQDILIPIVLLLLQLIPFSADAASSSEIKRQIDALKEQKEEIESQIEEVKAQYQQNENEIADIIARKNVIDQEINLLHECLAVVPAIDISLEYKEMKHIHTAQTNATIANIQAILSDTQFRRVWLHYGEGMTTREIALIEGSTHQAVCKSIKQARKNILKHYQKWVAKKT